MISVTLSLLRSGNNNQSTETCEVIYPLLIPHPHTPPHNFYIKTLACLLASPTLLLLGSTHAFAQDESREAYQDGRCGPDRRQGERQKLLYEIFRKKKAVHKTTTTDDKRLQSTLKRIGVNTIPAIEEVNIFQDDVVIQFINPKVQASIAANTWVVSGSPQTKSPFLLTVSELQDILPGIINQLGPDNLENLRKLAEQFGQQAPTKANTNASADVSKPQEEDDDDEVPELVEGETFEAVAEEGHAS
ncbi:Basic transcription factor 3-like protein [Drosera capensis]